VNTGAAETTRTDTHIGRAQQEISQLDEQIASGLEPHPIRQRLIQRRASLQNLIDKHDQTRIRAVNVPQETS
jgi:hypothetical protein